MSRTSIASEQVGNYEVTTFELHLGPGSLWELKVYETVVFKDGHEDDYRFKTWRYWEKEEAIHGHDFAVKAVKTLVALENKSPNPLTGKYRLRTAVINATQWFKVGDHPCVMADTVRDGHGLLYSMEGFATKIKPGDWIIEIKEQGIGSMSNEDFVASYEEVIEK